MNIIDSTFFQHMFFDQYILDERGGLPENVINIFESYLIRNRQGLQRNIFFDKVFPIIPKLGYKIFNNTYTINTYTIPAFDNTYNEYLLYLIKNNIVLDKFLLISGFRNFTGGHAVNIYIEKKLDDNYTMSIINSGLGVNRHGSINGKNAKVIIKFKNITIVQVKELYIFSYFINNYDFRTNYQSILDRHDTLSDLNDPIKWPITSDITDYLYDNRFFENLFIPRSSLDMRLQNNNDFINYFYDNIFKIIGQNISNPHPYEIIIDIKQFSGSCSYFSTYYFLKHFIFSTHDEFNDFIKMVKLDIIEYFITNFNTLVYLLNKNKYNMKYFNIAHILLKDYNNIISDANKVLLKNIITVQYKIIDVNKIIIPNKNRNTNLFFTEINYDYNLIKIQYNVPGISNGSQILRCFESLLNRIVNHYFYYKNNKINALYIGYILIRSTKLISDFFISSGKIQINYTDLSTLTPTINNILTLVQNLEIAYNIFRNENILLFYSNFINIQIINALLSNINTFTIPLDKSNSMNMSEENLNDFINRFFILRPYFNLNININNLQEKIRENLGLFFNNKTSLNPIDFQLFTNYLPNKSHMIQKPDEWWNFNRKYYDISNLDSYYMHDHNILAYNINQINSNNYNLINDEKIQTIMGSSFSNKFDNIDNNYNNYPSNDYQFKTIINNDYIYNYNLNFNSRGMINIYSKNVPNTNYDNQKVLIANLNIENFFKYIDQIIPYMVDQYIYLLYIYRYDESRIEISKFVNNDKNKNFISYYLFNEDLNKNNILEIFLLYIIYENNELLKSLPHMKEIYENYYIKDGSDKIYIFSENTNLLKENKAEIFKKKTKIASDLLNMIMFSIQDIKDTLRNMEYDSIFFNKFESFISYNAEKYIKDYEIFIFNDHISMPIDFYDYIIYTDQLDNKVYYNSNYNYFIPITIEIVNAFMINKYNIIKVIEGSIFRLYDFPYDDVNKISLFIKLIRNITSVYIWKDDITNDIIIELINYDKIYFKYSISNDQIKFINTYSEINQYNNLSIDIKEYIVKIEYDTTMNSLTNDNILFGLWIKGSKNHFILYDEKDLSYNLLILNSNEYVNNYKFFDVSKELYWSNNDNLSYDDKNKPFILQDDKKYYILKFSYNYIKFDCDKLLYIPLMNSLILANNNLAIYLILSIFVNTYNFLKNDDKLSDSYEFKLYKYLYKYIDIPYIILNNAQVIDDEDINDMVNERDEYFSYEDKTSITDLNIQLSAINIQKLVQIKSLSDNIKIVQNKKEFTDKKKSVINEEGNEILKNFINEFRGNCIKENLCSSTEKIINGLTNDQEVNDIKIILQNLISIPNKLPLLSNIYITNRDILYNKLINLHFQKIYDTVINENNCNCFTYLKDIEFLDSNNIYTIDNILNPRNIEDILFELHSGFFIRADQKKMLYNNTTDDSNNKIIDDLRIGKNNKIYEILMGRGKTSTITPLVLLNQYFTKKSDIVNESSYYIVLPKHLVPSSFDIIVRFSQLFYNFKIKTYSKKGFIITNSEKLKESQIINIISDDLLKEYTLQCIMDEGETEKGKKPQILKKDLSFNYFKKPNLFIYDEIDSLIDPFKSDLNKPINIERHINHDFIVNNLIKINKNLYWSVIEPSRADNNYGIAIVENKNKELEKKFKEKMIETIESIKQMTYNQNYGFGNPNYNNIDDLKNDKEDKYKGFFIAVPYTAINLPVNGSEFSDFELALSLTILSYLETDLRKEDIFIYLDYILKYYISGRELIPLLFPNIIKVISIELLDIYNIKDTLNKLKFCEDILNDINNNDDIIDDYLIFIINKFFKISDKQYNISMIDMFTEKIATQKIAFSGSVNFCLPKTIIEGFINNFDNIHDDIKNNLFENIIIDDVTRGSIYSSLYGITQDKDIFNKIISYNSEGQTKDIIEENFFKDIFVIDILKNYGAIIDTAGLILEKNTEDVIKELNNIFTKAKNLKSILYVNNKSERMIYTIDNKIVNRKYNDEKFNNCFIFYDNKNTVGIDFKQPAQLKGLITISSKNNLTEVSQGIFRLRNINFGHNVDFYVDKLIIKEYLNEKTTEEDILDQNIDQIKVIINNLSKNDAIKKTLSTFNMQLQCLKFLDRSISNNKNSYLENLYYDLIPTSTHIYLKKENFINSLIEEIKNKIEKNNLLLKIIPFKYQDTKTNSTNLSIELAINVEVDLEIESNIEQKLNVPTESKNLLINLYEGIHKNIGINNIDEYYNIEFKYINMTNININCPNLWTINYSFLFVRFLHNRFIPTNSLQYEINNRFIKDYENFVIKDEILNIIESKYYFLWKSSNKEKLTIITYLDYILLLKDYQSTKKLEYNNCIILDCYNNIVFQINKSLKKPLIPNEILILFFITNLDIYESCNAIINISKIPNHLFIIDYINSCLMLNKYKNFNLYEGINLSNLNDYKTWQDILFLPTITNETKRNECITIIYDNYTKFESGSFKSNKITWNDLQKHLNTLLTFKQTLGTTSTLKRDRKKQRNKIQIENKKFKDLVVEFNSNYNDIVTNTPNEKILDKYTKEITYFNNSSDLNQIDKQKNEIIKNLKSLREKNKNYDITFKKNLKVIKDIVVSITKIKDDNTSDAGCIINGIDNSLTDYNTKITDLGKITGSLKLDDFESNLNNILNTKLNEVIINTSKLSQTFNISTIHDDNSIINDINKHKKSIESFFNDINFVNNK
jgi:hypothetical protein